MSSSPFVSPLPLSSMDGALYGHARSQRRASRLQRGQKQFHLTNQVSAPAAPSAPRTYAPSQAMTYGAPPLPPPPAFPPQYHTASMASLSSMQSQGYGGGPTAGMPLVQQAAGGLPPFPFLRLKSFSPHTHAVLRKLEGAILAQPLNPEAYLALGEEYRVLGARHSYLRVLEYGKQHFPNELEFRTLLYQHQPHRARTPPPAEPAIQIDRNTMYDYKWRHREPNMFPKQILKLDTSVPPYGRQLRQHYMLFLDLLRQEDTYLTPAKKAQLHAEAIRAMEAHSAKTAQENEIALIIPAHFNKVKGGPPATVTIPSTPLTPSTGTPRTGSKRFLSPSIEQRRRESGGPFSPILPSNTLTSPSSRRRSSSDPHHLSALQLSTMTKEEREKWEKEREEQQERRWKQEEALQAERERREAEDLAWRERGHAAAAERARVKSERAAAAAAEAQAKEDLLAHAEAKEKEPAVEHTTVAPPIVVGATEEVTPTATEASPAMAPANHVEGAPDATVDAVGAVGGDPPPSSATHPHVDVVASAEPDSVELTLTGAEYIRFGITARSLVKLHASKVTAWANDAKETARASALPWNQGPGVSVTILAAPLDAPPVASPKNGSAPSPAADWRVLASTEVAPELGVQVFHPVSVDAAFTGLEHDADRDRLCRLRFRVTLHSGGESHKHAEVLGEGTAIMGDVRAGKPVSLFAAGSPASTSVDSAVTAFSSSVGSLSVDLTTVLAPESDSIRTLPEELLESIGVAMLQLNTTNVKKPGLAIFAGKTNLVHSVSMLSDALYTPTLKQKVEALTVAQITAGGGEVGGSAWCTALSALLDDALKSSGAGGSPTSAASSLFSSPGPWSLVRSSEIAWDCLSGQAKFQPMEIALADLCRCDPYRPLLVQLRHVDAKKLQANTPTGSGGARGSALAASSTPNGGMAAPASCPPPPAAATEDVGRFVTNLYTLLSRHTLRPSSTAAATAPVAKKPTSPRDAEKYLYDCLVSSSDGPKKNGHAFFANAQFLIAHHSCGEQAPA